MALKFKLGKTYAVKWIDHDQLDSKTNQEACYHEPTILTTYGLYIGKNKYHYIFAYNYENSGSANNDFMRILKDKIMEAKEIK